MTMQEYLRSKREEKQLSLREAEKLSGVSFVTIRGIENGTVESPAFEKIIKLLNAYHADITDFLKKTGYLPKNVELIEGASIYRAPIVSWKTAEKLDDTEYVLKHDEIEGWITSDNVGQNVFALRVSDDSMEPEFQEGDTIIVDPEQTAAHNDFVIAKNDRGEIIFSQLKIYGGAKVLHPLNPKYPDIELTETHQYRIIGKVVEKKKKY